MSKPLLVNLVAQCETKYLLYKNPQLQVFFFYMLKMVYCVYSVESPYRGDSDENTQLTSMLKKSKRYHY